MYSAKNNITNNDTLSPDTISETLSCFIANDYYQWKDIDRELIDSIYTLNTICENPYNDEKYRVLYDVLSAVAAKIAANDYYQ